MLTTDDPGAKPLKVAVLSGTVAVTVTFPETSQVLFGGICEGGEQVCASTKCEVDRKNRKTNKTVNDFLNMPLSY